jgi:OCT family organic cation transporter-like MFS transporter 4/5
LSDLIGGWGPFQWNIFMFDITVQLATMANVITMSFMAPKVNFYCDDYHPAFNSSVTTSAPNPLVDPHINHKTPGFMKCLYYDPTVVNGTGEACSSFTYDTRSFGRTLTADFDLVCDRYHLPSVSQALYVLGYFIASFLAGHMADRYGRLPVLWVSVFVELIAGLCCAFSFQMWFFMVSRFILGISVYAKFMTAYTLVMEVAGAKERSVFGPLTRMGRSIGIVVLTIVAYFIRDYRYIQLAVTVPQVIWLYWLTRIPESPRWLLCRGKIDEATNIIEDAVRTNGIDLMDTLKIKDVRNEVVKMYEAIQMHKAFVPKHPESAGENEGGQQRTKTLSFISLFRTPVMRRNSIIMCFNWFITVFIYYALSLNVQDLGGNIYVNFLISGLVEIPSITLCIYSLKKAGRRTILASSMIVLFLASVVSVPFFFIDFSGSVSTRVSLAMMGKFAATIAFSVNYLYSTEIYPTEIRQIGLGVNSATSRLGSMLSPFIKELNEFTHVSVSMTVFGITSLLNAFLVMLLPETKGQTIPDTIEQVESRGKTMSGSDGNEGGGYDKDFFHQELQREIMRRNQEEKMKQKGSLSNVPVHHTTPRSGDRVTFSVNPAEAAKKDEKVDNEESDTKVITSSSTGVSDVSPHVINQSSQEDDHHQLQYHPQAKSLRGSFSYKSPSLDNNGNLIHETRDPVDLDDDDHTCVTIIVGGDPLAGSVSKGTCCSRTTTTSSKM